jgi:integrase
MRKYGTGSLHQRQSDGRWIGRLPDGRGGYRYVTGTDKEDVRKRLDEARRARDRMTSGSPSHRGGERLRDLVARYQADVDPVRNRPRTVANNAQVARDHILPAMGSIRVRQLEPSDVQAMVTSMTAHSYSPKTISNTVHVLSAILQHAMREEGVERNVARLVVLPPVVRARLPSLRTDELHAFLVASKGEPLWPIWALAATTGMRIGEVLGLLWKDIGPADATVDVTGQYRRVGVVDGGVVWERVEPKTPKSRRRLHLPALAREAIRVQRAQATSAKIVFARRNGQPLDRSWVTRQLAKALEKHGFPHVRLHSFRHSAAVTMLDNVAGDLRAVSATLGHSTLAITADIYGAEADEARRRAADAMDRAMEKEARTS